MILLKLSSYLLYFVFNIYLKAINFNLNAKVALKRNNL